jgi:hypothetical protein
MTFFRNDFLERLFRSKPSLSGATYGMRGKGPKLCEGERAKLGEGERA